MVSIQTGNLEPLKKYFFNTSKKISRKFLTKNIQVTSQMIPFVYKSIQSGFSRKLRNLYVRLLMNRYFLFFFIFTKLSFLYFFKKSHIFIL